MLPIQAMTQDCFGAIRQIRRVGTTTSAPDKLQKKLRAFIDKLQSELKDADYSAQDIEDITYAIVALADEVALNAGDPLAEFWMGNLLQFRYFRENTAGTGFFDRLQELRGDPSRKDAFLVYVLCIWFGFQGKHRIRGGEVELMELIEDLDRDVRRLAPNVETISPHGERPAESLGQGAKSVPVVLISAGILAAAFLVYGGLRWSLSSTLSDLKASVAATAKP